MSERKQFLEQVMFGFSQSCRRRNGVSQTPLLVAILCAAVSATVLFSGFVGNDHSRKTESSNWQPLEFQHLREPIEPVPATIIANPAVIALGKKLFHETGLSADGTISCASCHDLKLGGTDRRRVSLGVYGRRGSTNAPTVFNSGLNFAQFWDGRAESLELQIDGPLTHPAEMDFSWPSALSFLNKDPNYRRLFQAAFESEPTEAAVKSAIAEFERSLLTPNSKFDQWLQGDQLALSEQELRGYQLFKSYRCVTCHQGQNVGGNSFQKLGIMQDYFEKEQSLSDVDLGRFNQTGEPADRHVFRVPPLRNVDLTAPYFHDGSAATLPQAVSIMIQYQLGRPILQNDVEDLCAFLKTLSGQIETNGELQTSKIIPQSANALRLPEKGGNNIETASTFSPAGTMTTGHVGATK